ncbi:MAG: amidase family protein [Dehalococcoidia bacterium]
MGEQIWTLGAADLAGRIAAKELKSAEVVEALLARIEAINPRVHAITAVLADEALAAARSADEAVVRGDPLGPLHGVPMTVKENIDVAGSATTQGVVAMAQAVPPVDAPHIAQLRAAGAIPFARTNLPDFGLRWHTDNDLHGPTKNAWDPSLTPGGSSGGEAVALATGMSPLGMGNDLGGSLRWPSQCAGTAALKTTFGRVPFASAIPPEDMPPSLQFMAVEGPMARRVRDLRLAYRSMCGPDARDPWYIPAPLDVPPPGRPLRIAVTADPAGRGVDADVAEGVGAAATALREAGHEVVDAEPPAIDEGCDLWAAIVRNEVQFALFPMLEPILGRDGRAFLEHVFKWEGVPALDLPAYVMVWAQRQNLARRWEQFFEQYDLVLGPVSCAKPFPVGRDLESPDAVMEILENLRLVVTVNLLGLPAAVVAAGMGGGLPRAVQCIGPRYHESRCLDAAEAIEERLGVLTPIDPRGDAV